MPCKKLRKNTNYRQSNMLKNVIFAIYLVILQKMSTNSV